MGDDSSEEEELSQAEQGRRATAAGASAGRGEERDDSSSENSGCYWQNHFVPNPFLDSTSDPPLDQATGHGESAWDPYTAPLPLDSSVHDEALPVPPENQGNVAPRDVRAAAMEEHPQDEDGIMPSTVQVPYQYQLSAKETTFPQDIVPLTVRLVHHFAPHPQHPSEGIQGGNDELEQPPPWFQKFAKGFIQLWFQSLITQLPRDYIPADGGTVPPPAVRPINVNEERKNAVAHFKACVMLALHERHSEFVEQQSSPTETLVPAPLLPSPTREGWRLHMYRDRKKRESGLVYKRNTTKKKTSGKTKTHRTQRPRKKQKTGHGAGPPSSKKDSGETTTIGDDHHHHNEGKDITDAHLRQNPEGP